MPDSSVNIVLTATDKASNVINGMTKGAIGGFTELSSMLGLAAGAFDKVQRAVDATVGEVLKYDKTVRDLSRNLGTSTEETSRLIQVADDYKIEVGTLETAMRLALKNGFEPTVDNLADLADRYVALDSPTERAAMLTEIFGRNWAAITPMLEQGGDALRQAAADMDTALIRTQDQVDASRELEIQMDALNDKLYGYKLAIGTAVIPSTNQALSAFTNWTEGVEKLWETFTAGEATLEEFLKYGYAMNGVISELTHGRFAEAKVGAENLLTAIGDLGDGTNETTIQTEQYSLSASAMTAAQNAAGDSSDGLSEDLVALSDGLVEVSEMTSKFSAELVFNKAAANLDAEAALELGRALGVVDEKTVLAMQGIEELRAKYDTNKDGAISATEATAGYSLAVKNLYDNINKLESKEVTVKVNIIGGNEAKKYAEGYDQYVPAPGAKPSGPTDPRARLRASGGPVSAGGAYIVGEEGPEMFVPNQSGTILPNNVVNNFNMTINTSAPYEPIVSDFNMMRALAGV
jgi:hypothetical protein